MRLFISEEGRRGGLFSLKPGKALLCETVGNEVGTGLVWQDNLCETVSFEMPRLAPEKLET